MTTRAMRYLDGLIAGIIGAAVIAIWLLFIDTVSGLPFYAPTVLGTGLFLGPEALSSTEGVQFSLKLTLMYTWVHGLVFVVLGEIAAYFLLLTGRNPNLGFFLLLFVILELGLSAQRSFLLSRFFMSWPGQRYCSETSWQQLEWRAISGSAILTL
jgi:hypothetical protein